MPIHATTYRHYEGARRPLWRRCFVIAASGTAIAVKRWYIVMLVLLLIAPAMVFGLHLFVSVSEGEGAFLTYGSWMAGDPGWKPWLHEHPGLPGMWTLIFTMYVALWQPVLAAVIVTAVGPTLISQDLRARALQVYYSRPITRTDYLVGKLLVVATFVALVTVVPGALLWLVGVVISRDPAAALASWRVPAGIVLSGALIAAVSGVLVLLSSSFSRRSSYVGIAWALLVIMSDAAYLLVQQATGYAWAFLLSIRANVVQVSAAIFGAPLEYHKFEPPQPWYCNPAFSALLLAAVVAAALAILYRRMGRLEGEH